MKILLTALMLIIAHNSLADGLYTGAWTYHYSAERRKDLNQTLNQENNLLAYEYESYAAGAFKNSFGDTTYLAGKYFKLAKIYDIQFGVFAGATYGYKNCIERQFYETEKIFCPMLLPEFRYTKYTLQPSFMVFKEGIGMGLRWDI